MKDTTHDTRHDATTGEYDELAAQVEAGDITIKPATLRRGAAAQAEAQQALIAATGAATIEDAPHLALGRPPVGSTPGASPVIRARVPQVLKDLVAERAARENRTESGVVREALARYVGAAT